MATPEPLNSRIPNARRSARRFTPHTPFHHPHLDQDLRKEDLDLVPPALFPGRTLNRQLPRPAVTNIHVMLKLTNDRDELIQEFHDKIPQIDDVLGLWGELKEASPAMIGEAQLRAGTRVAGDQGRTTTEEKEGTVFNLVSKLDTPGRADVIYLTNAVEDSGKCAEDSSVPSNLRTIEWLGFDGSYAHLEDAEPKMVAFPNEQDFEGDVHYRRNSTPSNLRVTEWLNDHYTDLPSEAYSAESGSDATKPSEVTSPYETFWINHDSYGAQLALKNNEGDVSSSKS